MSDAPSAEPRGQGLARPRVRLGPRWAVIGIFLILLVGGIAATKNFLMPVILAFLLALVFTPLRRSLNRLGIPSGACAFLVIGTLSSVLAGGIIVLSEPVSDWAARAPQLGYQLEAKIRSLREPVQDIAEAGEKIDELAENVSTGDAATPKVEIKEQGFSAKLAGMAPMVGAQVAFVLVLLFFLIASGDMFYEKLVHVMPTWTDKRRALRIVFDIERRLARYLSTITLINALLGIGVGTAMWLIGMPTPVLFGLMAFLLNFIPYVGAVAGIVLTTLIGLISLPEPWWALMAGLSYFALTTLEGQFITPYFVGRILRLNTVIVFVSIAFWAWLWSVVGMIIAVPVLVVLRVLSEHIDALEPLGDFLTARGDEVDVDEAEDEAPRSPPGAAAGDRSA